MFLLLIGFYFIVIVLALRYLRFFRPDSLPAWSFSIAFLIKSLIGISFIYLYIDHYPTNTTPSDAIRFMREGKILNSVFWQSPKDYFSLIFEVGDTNWLMKKYMNQTFLWDAGSLTLINDSKNVIKIHSLFHFFSNGSPMIHVFFMNFISLIGLRFLFQAILPYTKARPSLVFFTLLLFPSILFWGSGLLKEPLLFLGIGLIARVLLLKTPIFQRVLLGFIGAIVTFAFKPYILICLLPAISFYLTYNFVFQKKWLITLVSLSILALILLIALPRQRNSSLYYLSMKQFQFANTGRGGLHLKADTCFYEISPANYKNVTLYLDDTLAEIKHTTPAIYHARKNRFPSKKITLQPNGKKWHIYYFFPGANSFFEVTEINFSFLQLVKNIPEAFVNAYFRPFLNDKGSSFKYLAIIETWGLTFFLFYAILKPRKTDPKTRGIIISLLLFSISLLLLIGWTISVSGAIFRYRFPAYLALFIIGLILFSPGKRSLSQKNE